MKAASALVLILGVLALAPAHATVASGDHADTKPSRTTVQLGNVKQLFLGTRMVKTGEVCRMETTRLIRLHELKVDSPAQTSVAAPEVEITSHTVPCQAS